MKTEENQEVNSQKILWNKAAEELAKKYNPEKSIRIPLIWNWPPKQSGRFIFDFSVIALSLELPPNSLILDFAAGSCWVSEWLHQLGFRTISFDVSLTNLKYGKERFSGNNRKYSEFSYYFVCADGEKLPFRNGMFDAVVCFNALHHMPSYENVLHELYRILKPEGKALFSEPGLIHADSPLSKREVEEFMSVEKSINIDEIFDIASRVGFKKMMIKPVVYPDCVGFEFHQWKQMEIHQKELVNGFITHLTNTIRDWHPIFILNKSDKVIYDSRYPNILRADISLLQIPQKVQKGQRFQITARVKNIGDTIWLHKFNPFGGHVTFGVKQTLLDGKIVTTLMQESIGKDIHPNEELEITVAVIISSEPGKYLLKFDMVDEQRCWFSEEGSQEVVHPIRVLAP